MGKHRRNRLLRQRPVEGLQRIFPIKQLSSRHCDLSAQRMQRAGHRVMLKTGNHNPVPRMNQGAYGHVQTVGTVHGKNNPFRRTIKQLSGQIPAAEYRFGRFHRRRIPATPRVGAAEQRPVHRKAHCLRFMQGCRAVIQINHAFSSSSPPSSRCK